MLTLTLLINYLVNAAWNVFKGGTTKDANTKPLDTDTKPPAPQIVNTPVVPPQSIRVGDSGTVVNSSRAVASESVVVPTQATVTSRPPPPPSVSASDLPTPASPTQYNQVHRTQEDILQPSDESGNTSDETMASVKGLEEMSELSLLDQPGVRQRSARGRAKVTSKSNTSQGQTKVILQPGRGRSAVSSRSAEVGFNLPQGHVRDVPRATRGRAKVMTKSDKGHPRDGPRSFVDDCSPVKSNPRRGQDGAPSLDDWTPAKPKPQRARRAGRSTSEKPLQPVTAATTSTPPPPPTSDTTTTTRDPSLTQEMRRSNKFPFLLHAPTVEHVGGSTVMFIMRGLPGSGKSTVVKLLTETYPDAVVCSADDHFLLPDGTYRFRQEGLKDAHEACQRKARTACEHAAPVVIIDNTNVRVWEMNHYVTMAYQHGYTTVTVEPRTAWRMNARELATRNKHGVTEDIIQKKVTSYEQGLPLYYGWFLNRHHSNRVMEAAETYFGMTLRAFPEFRTLMDQGNSTQGQTTMTSVYWQEGSSSDRLHCTAFFANRGRTQTAAVYHSQPHVTEAMGRAFTLEVVGFVFTNKTAGARIRLSPKLMPLWGKDDNERRHGVGATASRSDSANWRSREGRLTDNTSYSSAAGYSSTVGCSLETSRFRPVVGEGSRAHLTLGYTKASKAVQTGFDLQQVVQHEAHTRGHEDADGAECLDGAAIHCYDNAFWVVYLDEPISIQTLFSGRY